LCLQRKIKSKIKSENAEGNRFKDMHTHYTDTILRIRTCGRKIPNQSEAENIDRRKEIGKEAKRQQTHSAKKSNKKKEKRKQTVHGGGEERNVPSSSDPC
jgi:hypothetical protein